MGWRALAFFLILSSECGYCGVRFLCGIFLHCIFHFIFESKELLRSYYQIKSVTHIFPYSVYMQNTRFQRGLKNMIKLFEDIFGPGFWPNVILAASRYQGIKISA